MSIEPSPRRSALGLFFAAITVLVPACSSETLNSTRGKVLVNGQPAVGATIIFHPEGGTINSTPATATAGADGSFTLVTGNKTGLPAGKYIVTVVWPDPAKKPTESQAMMGLSPDAPDLLKGKYADAKTSTLRAEIKSGENELEPFDLK